MDSFRVEILADDPAVAAELRRELEALRGQEPAGAELRKDESPRTRMVVDPLVATAIVALVGGLAGGAGQQIGITAMNWLVEKIREIVKKRKKSVILTVGGVSQQVDAQTRPEDAAKKLVTALDS